MEIQTPPSRRRILAATLIAAAVATLILVTVVLPAEYGVDPLHTGAALGLTALSSTSSGDSPVATLAPTRPEVNAAEPGALKQDHFEVELRPFEGVEYKYRMEKGANLVYAWTATAKVAFEFHGEPDGAPAKYFESYEKAEGLGRSGAFTAPTTGIHGWYWENPGATRVTITLDSAGFYGDATEFRDGERIVHSMTRR